MNNTLKYLFLVLIVFSFVAPFFSDLSYTFCPSNPERGFICHCIYKDDKSGAKKQDIVYSSGVKKQLESKSFNSVVLFIEDKYGLIFYRESGPAIFEYRFLYNSIPRIAPWRPT